MFFAAGPVTFIDPVKFQGSMAVNGTVDGANLVFIYQDVVFKSKYKAWAECSGIVVDRTGVLHLVVIGMSPGIEISQCVKGHLDSGLQIL